MPCNRLCIRRFQDLLFIITFWMFCMYEHVIIKNEVFEDARSELLLAVQ